MSGMFEEEGTILKMGPDWGRYRTSKVHLGKDSTCTLKH